MQYNISSIPLLDILQILVFTVAAIGLILNAWQIHISNRQRRSEIVTSVVWKILDSNEISEAYYAIEYGKFKYNSDFHGSEMEQKLDKLIGILDMLAKQYFMGLLKKNDISVISYRYLVIYQNGEIQKYFDFLDSWRKDRGIAEIPFANFRKLGVLVEKYYFT
jgi:hypothetical protein